VGGGPYGVFPEAGGDPGDGGGLGVWPTSSAATLASPLNEPRPSPPAGTTTPHSEPLSPSPPEKCRPNGSGAARPLRRELHR
jgi:hypothetical protein